ncbi:hypothetical protein KW797_01950 [Candidatus Parcubacteria bacterium]|nr:hypothetical protein [Candidatus Parcubacteria bacterium]
MQGMSGIFIVKGVTGDITTCECCGKMHLKRTVILLDTETDQIVHYGSDCAVKAMHGTGVNVTKSVLEEDAAAVAQAMRWLSAGHSPEDVAHGLSYKYGYSAQVRNGAVEVRMSSSPDLIRITK